MHHQNDSYQFPLAGAVEHIIISESNFLLFAKLNEANRPKVKVTISPFPSIIYRGEIYSIEWLDNIFAWLENMIRFLISKNSTRVVFVFKEGKAFEIISPDYRSAH